MPDGDDLLANVEFSSPRPGVILMNHAAEVCEDGPCCIHNPSDHHMASWTMAFRADRARLCPTHEDHVLMLTERICPAHGVGHPDPDSLAWLRQHDPKDRGVWGVHGCCGDCREGSDA